MLKKSAKCNIELKETVARGFSKRLGRKEDDSDSSITKEMRGKRDFNLTVQIRYLSCRSIYKGPFRRAAPVPPDSQYLYQG